MKNKLSLLKTKIYNKVKNNSQNFIQIFKENFKKSKEAPKSKKKSMLLGFTTVLGIFSITLLAPVLSAVAKDIPNNPPKPTPNEICPAPSNQPVLTPSQQIIAGLAGAATTICSLAVTSGSFAVGAVCGLIIVIGILKAQGK